MRGSRDLDVSTKVYKYYIMNTYELSNEEKFTLEFFECLQDSVQHYKKLVHEHDLDIAFEINRDKSHVRKMELYNIVAIYKEDVELAHLLLLTARSV